MYCTLFLTFFPYFSHIQILYDKARELQYSQYILKSDIVIMNTVIKKRSRYLVVHVIFIEIQISFSVYTVHYSCRVSATKN